jgi:hypothetical protein
MHVRIDRAQQQAVNSILDGFVHTRIWRHAFSPR